VAEAPVVEKRPRGWNLRKGAKDTKAAEPVVETPPAPVRTRAEKRPVIKAPEPAPAPVAEKRGRGWNLRKGAKDTKASETTPPVDVLVMSDNPPEVDARRVASRRNTGIATEPVKADKEKLPAKVRSGRLTVA
jgi:hypothetical protein